jgi:hypothetical protein
MVVELYRGQLEWFHALSRSVRGQDTAVIKAAAAGSSARPYQALDVELHRAVGVRAQRGLHVPGTNG